MLARLIEEKKDIALLLVRIAFGLIFIVYGWRHVTGLEGYEQTFTRVGIPLPGLMAPFVAWLEFLGGIAALVGVLTRYAGGLLAIVMVVSTLTVKLPAAFRVNPDTGATPARDPLGLSGIWDIDFALLVMGLVLFLMGPGKASLERGLFKREL